MMELLSLMVSKVIDIVVSNAHVKRDKPGPMRMYELYLSLREMLKGARFVVKKIEEAMEERDDAKGIAFAIKRQAEALDNFSGNLWGIVYHLRIFDPGTGSELCDVLGSKFVALGLWCDVLDQNRVRVPKLRRTLPELGKQVREFMPESDCYADLEKKGVIQTQTFDLQKRSDLQQLRSQALENIAKMESALARLADSIRENCEMKDLFVNTTTFEWRR
ncbi:MAG TPA: hypothetical protein VMH22_06490 [bacterium]|nr:hypothetical protein [bacterium]